MEFEFDPDKDAQNRFKHGLAFNGAARLFETADHLTVSSHRLIDGELRYKRIGPINHRLHTLVCV